MVERHIPASFPEALKDVNNLGAVETAVVSLIHDVKASGVERVGFVSGPVRDGHRHEDMQLLSRHSAELTQQVGFPVFSCTEIFYSGVWEHLPERHLPKEEIAPRMHTLFRGILAGGVTDIFMEPNWDKAEGAVVEYEAAEKLGLTFHDLLPSNSPIIQL